MGALLLFPDGHKGLALLLNLASRKVFVDMKKATSFIIALVFVLALGQLFTSGCVGSNARNQPLDFDGSRWVSNDPECAFVVDSSNPKMSLTIEGKEIHLVWCFTHFDVQCGLYLENNDPDYQYGYDDAVVWGKGIFSKKQFKYIVLDDPNGYFEGYESIVFIRDFDYEKGNTPTR